MKFYIRKSVYVTHGLLLPASTFMIDTASESSSTQHSNQSLPIKAGLGNETHMSSIFSISIAMTSLIIVFNSVFLKHTGY